MDEQGAAAVEEAPATNGAQGLYSVDPLLVEMHQRAQGHVAAKTRLDAMQCSHLLREILDACIAWAGHKTTLIQYEQRWQGLRQQVDEFTRALDDATLFDDERFRQHVQVSRETLQRDGNLRVIDREDQLRDVIRQLGVEDPGQVQPLANLAADIRRSAANGLHFKPEASDEEIIDLAAKAMRQFESLLDLIRPEFAPKFEHVDAFLERAAAGEAIGPDDSRTLAAALADDDAARTFFGKLSNPDWLEPLREAGALTKPDHPHLNEDGSITERTWWAGECLVRLVADAPGAVIGVMEKVGQAKSPEVASIWRRAGTLAPGDFYDQLEARIRADLQEPVAENVPIWRTPAYEIVNLVEHLMAEDLLQEAAKLVGDALLPLAAPEPDADDPWKIRRPWHQYRTRAGLDYHSTSRLLQAAINGMGNSTNLCLFHHLRHKIKLHLDEGSSLPEFEDATWLTRNDWDADDGGYEDLVEVPLRALYRECNRLIQAGMSRAELAETLWSMKWAAMCRLTMKLYSEAVEDHLEAIQGIILNSENLLRGSVHADYAYLLRVAAPALPEAFRDAFCELVQASITIEALREDYPDADEQELEGAVARQQTNMMQPLEGHLTGKWQEFYDAVNQQFGPARSPYARMEIQSGFGGRASEFKDKTVDEVLESLREGPGDDARPEDWFFEMAYTGLHEVMAERPEDFLQSDILDRLPIRYAPSVAYAIDKAIENNRLSGTAGIDLINQLTNRLNGDVAGFALSAARALDAAAKKADTGESQMEIAIGLLERFATEVPPPPCDNEWGTADTNLNHGRTRALEGLVDILRRANLDGPIHPGVAELAHTTLHRVIDGWPADNPMAAALIGHRFVTFWILDKEWLLGHPNHWRLNQSEHGRVAWIAYVEWNQPFGDTCKELLVEYEASLASGILPEDESSRYSSQYIRQLANHLLPIWYWGRGSKELREMIIEAPPNLARELVGRIQQLLANTPKGEHAETVAAVGDLLDQLCQRLKVDAGWDSRIWGLDRIITDGDHYLIERRLGWLTDILEKPGMLEVDAEILGALARHLPDIAGQLSTLLPSAIRSIPSYDLKDCKDLLQEILRHYVVHQGVGDRDALLDAADFLARRYPDDFTPLFRSLEAA